METKSPHNQTSVTRSIVILDFGSQVTQLIARRIREQNVFSVVLPCTAKLDEVRSYAPVGFGAFSRSREETRRLDVARG